MTPEKLEAIKTTIREYVRRVDLSNTPATKAFRDCYPDAVQEGEFMQAWQACMNERSQPPAMPAEVVQNASVEVEPILDAPIPAFTAPFKPKLKRGG